MKIIFGLLTLISGLLFIECSADRCQRVSLKKSKSIDVIDDSIFFKDITCMNYHEGNVYLSNPVTEQIYCLSAELRYISSIGKRGQGPGELLGIGQFAFCDTILSVLNCGNRSINLYTNGDELVENKFSPTLRFDPNFRYVFDGESIVASSYIGESPLIKYNVFTQEQTLFGEAYHFSSAIQARVRSLRFVVNSANAYLVVSNNQPFIECYDKDCLSLISKYDYSFIAEVAKSLKVIDEKSDLAENSYYTTCKDVYATDNFLYLLLADYTSDDYRVDKIVKLAIYPTIEAVAFFTLPDGLYESICVSSDDLVVYASELKSNTIGAYSFK